jgi:hypothetical protein
MIFFQRVQDLFEELNSLDYYTSREIRPIHQLEY